jgi:hypothetical protein
LLRVATIMIVPLAPIPSLPSHSSYAVKVEEPPPQLTLDGIWLVPEKSTAYIRITQKPDRQTTEPALRAENLVSDPEDLHF